MAAYAAFSDVTARAGRFAGFFTVAGKHPDQADVEAIITDLSADVDAAITARGFNASALSAGAVAALRDLVAFGALARALSAADPGPDAADLIARAWKTWNDAIAAMTDGTSSVIVELEAGAGGQAAVGAGTLWGDEPDYPTWDEWNAYVLNRFLNPFQAPMWAKGQKL